MSLNDLPTFGAGRLPREKMGAPLTVVASACLTGLLFWWVCERSHLFLQGSTAYWLCLLYTSPSPRDRTRSRMPSSA